MAKRKRESQVGFGRLLEAWVPPDEAGDPIGCIATTFTFNAAFFEEECLASFLGLESEPNEDGPAYLIEREEKLAKLSCAAVLVDSHHCRGSRNLRWDLLAARLPGIQHAKVSLLVWTNHVRLIIGSANLTEDGYRRNLEVYGVLDFFTGSPSPIQLLMDTTAFLGRIVQFSASPSGTESPSMKRWNGLLERVTSQCVDWGTTSNAFKGAAILVQALFIEPNLETQKSCFNQLQKLWPGGSPPITANVVSPFFDPPEATNQPAAEMLDLLRKRGDVAVGYHVTGEDILDAHSADEAKVMLHAPKSLSSQPHRDSCTVDFYRIKMTDGRPLHAKGIWLEDDRYALYQIGSSNFTSAGLGIAKRSNIEANLVYIVDAQRGPADFKSFEATFPASELVDEEDIQWKPIPNGDDNSEAEHKSLPPFFGDATFSVENGANAFLTLEFHGAAPGAFQLLHDGEDNVWLDSEDWKKSGAPPVFRSPWERARPPSGFDVRIDGDVATAWWPVNALSADSLPPPDELKDLPLEILIELLTSARPLHRQLAEYLKSKKHKTAGGEAVVVDPHKRVDTSRFLLQRTRRLSWALSRMRERLERPAATIEVLHWRLFGPVGVMAFSDAILREAKSPEESMFLLTELALELARAKITSAIGCLSPEFQKAEIQSVIHTLHGRVDDSQHGPDNLQRYVRDVFGEVCS